jgi:multisubunit Na+/H+ antiporter MnhB subunit
MIDAIKQFLDFVKAWAKAISALIEAFPVVAGMVTLLAVVAFILLERENNPGKDWTRRTLNFFIVLVGWAIVTALLGMIVNVITWTSQTIAFVYGKYASQPIAALIILAFAVLTFFIWRVAKPDSPSNLVKGLLSTVLGIVLLAVTVPILDFFKPSAHQQPEATKSSAQHQEAKN